MKIHRIFAAIALGMCIFPALASAQSFWSHSQVFTETGFRRVFQLYATDTSECLFVPGSTTVAQTLDGGYSWIFVGDTGGYNVPCFVHPTRNLIVLGCNSEKTETRVNGNVTTVLRIETGHILRSTDAGNTWTDTALGYLDTTKVQNSIGAMAALDSNHIFLPVDAKNFNPSDSDYFLHSSDGGVTWQSIPCPVSVHYRGSSDPTLA